MKQKITYLALMLTIIVPVSCCTSNSAIESGTVKNDKENIQMEISEMKIEIEANYTSSVGYGDLYKCDVLKSDWEGFSMENFTLIILAGSEFSDAVNENLSPKSLTINVEKKEKREGKKIAPINGFIDDDSFVWEITSID